MGCQDRKSVQTQGNLKDEHRSGLNFGKIPTKTNGTNFHPPFRFDLHFHVPGFEAISREAVGLDKPGWHLERIGNHPLHLRQA